MLFFKKHFYIPYTYHITYKFYQMVIIRPKSSKLLLDRVCLWEVDVINIVIPILAPSRRSESIPWRAHSVYDRRTFCKCWAPWEVCGSFSFLWYRDYANFYVLLASPRYIIDQTLHAMVEWICVELSETRLLTWIGARSSYLVRR